MLTDAVQNIRFARSLGIELAAADPAEVRGSSFIVVQTELADDDRRGVGMVTQTQAVLQKERE